VVRRIGILGGTFDPVHLGHLILAACARDQLACDELLFIPNVRSPIKPEGPIASFADRLAMITLAIGQTPRFAVSDIEGHRAGPSYTIDTLGALRAAHPDAELYLIVGSDAMRDFANWHEAGRVLRLARIAVVARQGEQPADDPRVAQAIDMPRIDVSASAIRARIGRGLSIDFLTPVPVAAYIHKHALYRTP
jgi:nicotinate-nucleotide adenylyltransferase